MPHLLIAGTTGSGKSACINSLLISLLYKASPQDVRIILVDPKLVEFTSYNGLPHLMIPNAITNVNQAINAFKWAVEEMERRYETLRENGHEPSEAFNETVEELTQSLMPLFAENGMDWMYANCSTTAQRGALDWMGPFHDAVKPVFEKLYREVACGNEAQRSIDTNSKPDYREGLEKELAALRESEMWRAGAVVRKLRPENN